MSAATTKQQSVLAEAIKMARSALVDAIKMDTAVAGKWKLAAERIVAAYGPKAFLAKKDTGFDKDISGSVKTLVSDVIGIPAAPTKTEDDSAEGDALRYEKQKAQMKVAIYLNRMKGYVVEGGERAEGTPKTPKQVFESTAKRIRNLYFKEGSTVTPVSPKFGRDIQILASALELMGATNIPFSTAWEASIAKFDGLDEAARKMVETAGEEESKPVASKKGSKAKNAATATVQ